MRPVPDFRRAHTAPPMGSVFMVGLLVVAVTVLVLWPGAVTAWSVMPALPESGRAQLVPAWGLLWKTLAWTTSVGVLATVLAWPAAWAVRARGYSVVPLLLTPLLLPSYLTYSGYGMLRAPRTLLGDWVERASETGWRDLPVFVGQVIALLGLVLWVWPIAAVVVGVALRRIPPGTLDLLQLDARPLARQRVLIRLALPGLAAAVGAVTLIMLGSAVPLHLAQAPTYAVKIWTDVTLKPGNPLVWLSAWPLIAVALIAGWVLAGRAATVHGSFARSASPAPTPRPAMVGAALLWSAAVVVPLAMFVLSLRNVESLHMFWRLNQDAVRASVAVAAAVGVCCIVLAAAVWNGLIARPGGSRARLTVWCVRLLLIAGLTPGILVGAAWLSALTVSPALRPLLDSPWVLVLGHLTRFAFVPALVGCWLAAAEPREQRELRALDGATGFLGWWIACRPRQSGALVATGLAGFALSLHEIEASIVLQPPGVPSLAQTVLGYLHYNRMDELSAAAVLIVGTTLIGALAAAVAGRRSLPRIWS